MSPIAKLSLRRSLRRWLMLSLVLGVLGGLGGPLAGCASAPRSGETLMESVRTYHEGMRWQRFAAAAGRLPPAERSAFVDEWDERASDLKITDYEIVSVVMRGAAVASVQVKISWYDETEGTLRDTHARQTWQRRGKLWLLTDEVRARGATMPGLAEPPPDAESAALAGPEAPRPGTVEGAGQPPGLAATSH